MMTLTQIIHNTETGEIAEVPLTAKEVKEVEKAQTENAAKIAEYEAKKAADAEAKAALLARLGLTEDELKTILG